MRFRFPAAGAGAGQTRITAPAPANYGRAEDYYPVQQEVDWTVARANRQLEEAIAVDGVPFQFWHRVTEGRFCTCQAAGPMRVEEVGGEQSPSAGMAPEKIDDIIVRPASSMITERRGNNDIEQLLFGGPEAAKAVEDKANSIFEMITGDLEGSDAGLDGVADEDGFITNPEVGYMYGAEKTPCGICFRTGRVGGYQLHNGRRIVLDAGENPKLFQALMVNDVRPYSFALESLVDSYVEWTLELPTYFLAVPVVQVRNNLTVARDVTIEYRLHGSNNAFQTLTPTALQSFNGTSTTLTIRVRPSANLVDRLVQFTHVELVFQLAPWLKLQMPSLDRTTNFAIFKGLSLRVAQFTLPPSLHSVIPECVVFDQKYNVLWKITNATDQKTAQQQVFGWTASAREVLPDETVYLLRMVHTPTVELTYFGLEPVQGSGLNSEDRLRQQP